VEALNEGEAAEEVEFADDSRGGRRVTEKGKDSEVADNEPRHRHATEAMHCGLTRAAVSAMSG